MSRKSTVLLFVACVLVIFAFQYIALVWSFADFHPGGDVEPNAELTRRAEFGSAMHQPFRIPLEWMTATTIRLTDGYDFVSSSTYTTLYGVAHWVILPLIYATILFFIFRLILISMFTRHRPV